MAKPVDRRDFLKTTTLIAGSLATGLGAAPAVGQVQGANDRIRLGYIGTGRMGRSNLYQSLATGRTEIAALCDVFEPSLAKALAMDGLARPDTYVDFRRILDRSDIDAVVISTPDHWHAAQTVMACDAGKDVFVEKPIATSIAEGRAMVNAARRTGRVVQTGTMQRSAIHFQRAVEIVRAGTLGKISFVRCWNTGNEYPAGYGNPADSSPPSGLDWDLWLGPAPARPFNANRFGISDDYFSTFRYFWDYAGGMLTDWGIHLMDIVLWAMEAGAPKRVTTAGGKFFLTDNRDTPDTLQSTFEYDNWVMTYTNQACNGHGFEDRGYGILFYGTDGTLFVDRGGYELMPEYQQDIEGLDSRPKTEAIRGRSTSGGNREHHDNWLDCLTTRQHPISDIEIGHESAVLPHLGNIAYRTGTAIDWDAESEKCLNNDDANALIGRAYRSPWTLPT